jgi:hypothetical protein
MVARQEGHAGGGLLLRRLLFHDGLVGCGLLLVYWEPAVRGLARRAGHLPPELGVVLLQLGTAGASLVKRDGATTCIAYCGLYMACCCM